LLVTILAIKKEFLSLLTVSILLRYHFLVVISIVQTHFTAPVIHDQEAILKLCILIWVVFSFSQLALTALMFLWWRYATLSIMKICCAFTYKWLMGLSHLIFVVLLSEEIRFFSHWVPLGLII